MIKTIANPRNPRLANMVRMREAATARRKAQGRKGLRNRPPKWLYPHNAERRYTAQLVAMVNVARAVAVRMLPSIETALGLSVAAHPRADADADLTIRSLSDSIRAIFKTDASRKAAQEMTSGVNQFNAAQFRNIVSTVLGVNIFVAEPWLHDVMQSSVRANVALISDIGDKTATQIEGIVTQAYQGAVRVEDLADDIAERFDVSESRARLIARDQTAKLNGNLSRLRQQNIGGEEYVWRTSLDERVRQSHAEHEGITYKWSAPPAETGNPGEDYQCRCTPEMVFPAEFGLGPIENDQTRKAESEWRKNYFGDDA